MSEHGWVTDPDDIAEWACRIGERLPPADVRRLAGSQWRFSQQGYWRQEFLKLVDLAAAEHGARGAHGDEESIE